MISQAEQTAVKVKKITKNYRQTVALDELKFDFPAGKITGVVGPNGSGKSTLLKSIVGLVKPTDGTVEVFGSQPSRELKEKVAFLPEINPFYDWMTVEQVIDFYNTQFDNFNLAKAQEITEFMNLAPDTKVKNLSMGMIARTKLIVTLAREVPLLIMDEPLSGIDPQSRARILESLVMGYKAGEQTIIFSTHEVIETEKFFDHVLFLEAGQVKLAGNADDIRQKRGQSIQELMKEVFL
jgi:ABC-2 type transport system ATP-binding protein